MLMTFYMFLGCFVLQIVLTSLMPKLAHEDPEKLYWVHPFDAVRRPGWPGLADYRVLAALVFAAFVLLYIIFR